MIMVKERYIISCWHERQYCVR